MHRINVWIFKGYEISSLDFFLIIIIVKNCKNILFLLLYKKLLPSLIGGTRNVTMDLKSDKFSPNKKRV